MSLTNASRLARQGRSTSRRGSGISSSTVKPAIPEPVKMVPISAIPNDIVPPAVLVPPAAPLATVVEPVLAAPAPVAAPIVPAPVAQDETIAIDIDELRGSGLAIMADIAALKEMESAETTDNPAMKDRNDEELRILERIELNAGSILSGAIGGKLWIPFANESLDDFKKRTMSGSNGKFDIDKWRTLDEKAVRAKFPKNFGGEGWK